MKKSLFSLLSLVFLFSVVYTGSSTQVISAPGKRESTNRFQAAGTFSAGNQSGFTREIVYPDFETNNRYLSELRWQSGSMGTFGSNITISYVNRFFLNIGGWLSLFNLGGDLFDYDWYYSDLEQWTHQSYHDIFVKKAYNYDINFTAAFFNYQTLSLMALAGFKQLYFSWRDNPREFTYTTGIFPGTPYEEIESPLHNYSGTFTEAESIAYEILMTVPYLGMGFHLENGPLLFDWFLTFSKLTYIEDHDHHILTGVHYYDVFQYCSTLGIVMQATWLTKSPLYYTIGLDLTYIPETRGDVHIYLHPDVYQGTNLDQGGVQVRYFHLRFAAGYRF